MFVPVVPGGTPSAPTTTTMTTAPRIRDVPPPPLAASGPTRRPTKTNQDHPISSTPAAVAAPSSTSLEQGPSTAAGDAPGGGMDARPSYRRSMSPSSLELDALESVPEDNEVDPTILVGSTRFCSSVSEGWGWCPTEGDEERPPTCGDLDCGLPKLSTPPRTPAPLSVTPRGGTRTCRRGPTGPSADRTRGTSLACWCPCRLQTARGEVVTRPYRWVRSRYCRVYMCLYIRSILENRAEKESFDRFLSL